MQLLPSGPVRVITNKQTNKSCFRINFNPESAQAPFATKMTMLYDANVCELRSKIIVCSFVGVLPSIKTN
jgi:hypothetical protein